MGKSIVLIKSLLLRFKPLLGAEYHAYKNHVYRVYYNCLLLDDDPENDVKYAIASVFHDIGIWTNLTIDYLHPSITQAKLYLEEINQIGWVKEISDMIYWHHKMQPHQGEYEWTVENFRRADWIDVSLGFLAFQADKKKVKANRIKFPNLGFHFFLLKKISKNFLVHPFNPLPMFSK